MNKIETQLQNQIYKNIIEDEINFELEDLINEGFKKIDVNECVTNFLGDKINDLNSKFNGDSNALDFMIIGLTGEGKSTLVNSILELKSGEDGAYVNEEEAESTTYETKRYNNTNKIGLNIWDTEGFELNEKQSFNKRIEELYKDIDKITFKDNILLYGLIYLTSADSFNEKDILDNILNNSLHEIPLKIVVTKDKSKKQQKRLSNTIKKKMGINPYFLGDSEGQNLKSYKNNIKIFLREFMEELDNEKLKNVCKFYYSLNILSIIMDKLVLTLNKVDKIALILPSTDKYIDYLKNRFEMDIKITFLGKEINCDNIFNKLDKIFNGYRDELKKKVDDENLKDDEEKTFVEKIRSWFYKNKLPDFIYINIYNNIKTLFIEKIKQKFREKILNEVDLNKLIKKYPDFTKIRNNIYKNFIIDSKNYIPEEL